MPLSMAHRARKAITIGFVAVAAVLVAGYFAVPPIASAIVRDQLNHGKDFHVTTVALSWRGPQHLRGLNVAAAGTAATLDVRVDGGLIPLVLRTATIRASVTGSAIIDLPSRQDDMPDGQEAPASTSVAGPGPVQGALRDVPPCSISVALDRVSIRDRDGARQTTLSDVTGTLDYVPGRTLGITLSARGEEDGTIEARLRAPGLIDELGGLDEQVQATLHVAADGLPLPMVPGWAVSGFEATLSTPGLAQSASLMAEGLFLEKGTQRGALRARLQLDRPWRDGGLVLDPGGLIGELQASDVPTAPLAPLLDLPHVDLVADIGPMLNLRIERPEAAMPLLASVETQRVTASARLAVTDEGTVTSAEDCSMTLDLRGPLVRRLTGDVVRGATMVTVTCQDLDLTGDDIEARADVAIAGPLRLVVDDRATVMDSAQFQILASTADRRLGFEGPIGIAGREASVSGSLRARSNDHIDGLASLWTRCINDRLGEVTLSDLPTASIAPWLDGTPIDVDRDLGGTLEATLGLDGHDGSISITTASGLLAVDAAVRLDGWSVIEIVSAKAAATVDSRLARSLVGRPVKGTARVQATVRNVNPKSEAINLHLQAAGPLAITLEGGGVVSIDAVDTTISGSLAQDGISVRGTMTSAGLPAAFDAIVTRDENRHVHATISVDDLPTVLVDAAGQFDGLLLDAVGPTIDVQATLAGLDQDTVTATATARSQRADLSTVVDVAEDRVSTLDETATTATLVLTPTLTSRLLRDLGPVLADIRTIDHPIQATMRNATIPLDSDLRRLNADVHIEIGRVGLDSGSITLRLLSLFNSSHAGTVPAFIDPIDLSIRKGVVRYDTFRVVIDDKYVMPFSGRVNLVNRSINLHTSVPLTGLGYSIKELRGLVDDIDVPLRVRGTIETPKVDVDPSFDLAKILQDAALSAIGDALGGDDGEGPNPLDLLGDLLRDR